MAHIGVVLDGDVKGEEILMEIQEKIKTIETRTHEGEGGRTRTYIGSNRLELEVGKIFQNQVMQTYGVESNVTFLIIREVTEQDYRDYFNYKDELPMTPYTRFFEIEALD